MFLTVCLSVNKPKRGTGDMFCTVADSIMAAVCLFVCLFCSADSATIARCGRRCVVRTKMQVEFEDMQVLYRSNYCNPDPSSTAILSG